MNILPRFPRSAIAAGIVLSLLVLSACGGRQEAPEPPPEPAPPPTCLPERWEQPPRDIGEVPPEREAPAEALDAFRPSAPAGDPVPEPVDDGGEDDAGDESDVEDDKEDP